MTKGYKNIGRKVKRKWDKKFSYKLWNTLHKYIKHTKNHDFIIKQNVWMYIKILIYKFWYIFVNGGLFINQGSVF